MLSSLLAMYFSTTTSSYKGLVGFCCVLTTRAVLYLVAFGFNSIQLTELNCEEQHHQEMNVNDVEVGSKYVFYATFVLEILKKRQLNH